MTRAVTVKNQPMIRGPHFVSIAAQRVPARGAAHGKSKGACADRDRFAVARERQGARPS